LEKYRQFLEIFLKFFLGRNFYKNWGDWTEFDNDLAGRHCVLDASMDKCWRDKKLPVKTLIRYLTHLARPTPIRVWCVLLEIRELGYKSD